MARGFIPTSNGPHAQVNIPTSATPVDLLTATDLVPITTDIADIQAKQYVNCVRLEAGKWIWDLIGGTHYVIPDSSGSLVVRATASPAPASTPTLNW